MKLNWFDIEGRLQVDGEDVSFYAEANTNGTWDVVDLTLDTGPSDEDAFQRYYEEVSMHIEEALAKL